MPIDLSNYPKNWKDLAVACKEAAEWKCEECGMAHMDDGTMGSCLTVHHPHCDTDNPEAVLIALCARCHLKADRHRRIDEKRGRELPLDKTEKGVL